MTMTPLHMTDHGHDLSAVGIVLSAHIAGMYAFAPISGRLTDRFGSPPVIYGGMAILAVAAVLAAVAPAEDDRVLLVALFLLGFGWNLGYVAGSALLTEGRRDRRADAGPGRRRRPDLEHGGDRLARLGRARGGRGIRGARGPRGGPRGGAGVVPDGSPGLARADGVDRLTVGSGGSRRPRRLSPRQLLGRPRPRGPGRTPRPRRAARARRRCGRPSRRPGRRSRRACRPR